MKINQRHTRKYYDYFDIPPDPTSFVACELSGGPANDIHHIVARRMGGTKEDAVHGMFNLMALSSKLHHKHGDIKKDVEMLKKHHMAFLQAFIKSGKDYEEFIKTYNFPFK